ncbi:MAG: gliding motility-associated C-terminal domain-containing protein [Saprospiraceae bacterium]
MKKRILMSMVASMLFTTIFAQKEGYIWHFGEKAILDFNGTGAFIGTTSSILTFEGSASICDADGKLLFYTNGGGRDPVITGQTPGAIWNRNDAVMYDMKGIEGGGFSAAQSSLITPKPGDARNYYVFTMDELEAAFLDPPLRGFSYFEVDMDQNGGLGGVVDYKESVEPASTEGLTGARHANGIDYWVVIFNTNTLAFNVFAVTASGVALSGAYQAASPLQGSGLIRISPNGKKLFAAGVLYDFDNATGVIANPVVLPNDAYGVTFSPNSRYLYLIVGKDFIRYTVDAPNVAATEDTIASVQDVFFQGGQMQVAPDGNLYFIEFAGGPSILSAVLCANAEKPCLKRNLFAFVTEEFPFLGLPNFTDHLFANDQVNIPLEANIVAEPPVICPGAVATLTAESITGESYQWSTGDTTRIINVTQPGVYSVTVSSGCCATGTASIEVLPGSAGNLAVDITGGRALCDSTALTLTADAEGAETYLWSTGDTSRSIEVIAVGTFAVTVTNACGQTAVESINVTKPAPISLDTVQSSAISCGGADTLRVKTNADSILWSTGESADFIAVKTPGIYTVTADNGCETASGAFEVLAKGEPFVMPNAFTPNGDGTNDVFRPVWDCMDANSYRFQVYSRWGKEVFRTTETEGAWDGKVDGSESPADVYVYIVDFVDLEGLAIRKSGDVTLLR